MTLYDLAKQTEARGIVRSNGRRLYGTAALLHFLRLADQPLRNVPERDILAGKAYVSRLLNAE